MRLRLVAEIRRKSTRIGRRAPTGSISPSWSARSSLTCTSARQLADLVEEERAAMGLAELADVLVGGAGEGALLVAEEDAFDEIVGDGAAIDGDEGLRAPVAGALDGAGDQLLADARFALDQDRDLRGGGALAERGSRAPSPGSW